MDNLINMANRLKHTVVLKYWPGKELYQAVLSQNFDLDPMNAQTATAQ
jgi:hypothetical protein